jgi:hypothetical protein
VVNSIVRLMRLASFVICAIVIVAFAIFAIDQTKTASAQQTEAIVGTSSKPATDGTSTAHQNGVHKAIDEASEKLTSPFAGVISSSSSEWAIHGVKLLLSLVVYGFGLGYLARVIRIRT